MKKLWKQAALGALGLAALSASLFVVADVKARSRLGHKFSTHHIDLPPPAAGDRAAVLRGQHLVEARYGCQHCHGDNLAGGVMLDEPAIGKILGPNLTAGQGSRTAGYTMADWDRIVRHGVKPDGSPAIMPSEDFFKMSDAELSDIVAFIRAAPRRRWTPPCPSLASAR